MQQESQKPQLTKALEGQETTSAKPRRKRTAKPKSKGLGDTIEKVTEATGIKAAVKAVVGDDCGCQKRKEILNKLFPYAKVMTEEQKQRWDENLQEAYDTRDITREQQVVANDLYHEIFGVKHVVSQCSRCLVERMEELAKVYRYSCE